MKKIIGLTGSTGSLGKIFIKNFSKHYHIKKYKGDILNKRKIFEWINNHNFQLVIHLAAIVPIKIVNNDRKYANKVNYIGTKNILDAIIKKKNIEWFFFASTSHVYQSSNKKISEKSKINPISYYGKTKLKAENYIQKKLKNKSTNYCIGRIFSTANLYQKKNYLVPDLKFKIKNAKKKIILKNLNHYRDFISMKMISRIIIKLYKKKFKGIINIGTGRGIFLQDIAKEINIKYKKKLVFYDNKISTSLISNNKKLKNIVGLNFSDNLKKILR